MRPNGAAQTLGISRPVGVYVLEVVQLIESNPAGRAIRIRRQCKGNAIAPSPTYLGGKQFGIDLVLVRLQEILESDDVGLDHLEDCKASVQAQFSRLRQQVIFGVVLQNE